MATEVDTRVMIKSVLDKPHIWCWFDAKAGRRRKHMWRQGHGICIMCGMKYVYRGP